MNSPKIHHIGIENVVYTADPQNKPILSIKSEDTVVFDCKDAFNRSIREPTDLPHILDHDQANPATGPVYIEGAMPGDTLEVHIKKIKVGDQGACCIIPNFGYLPEFHSTDWTWIIPIKDGYAEFSPKIHIPLAPFPGTLIVAPPKDSFSTLIPNEYGGNMDSKACQEGTIVYLPVFVEGACFGVGDVHAVQGDGEVCGTAVEVDAEVTIQFIVNKQKKISRPHYETKDSYMTTAWGETLDEATKLALEEMIDWLVAEKQLGRNEAYALCSCAVDLRISQVVDITPGVRAVLPKKIFR